MKKRVAEYVPLDWTGAAGMRKTLRLEHERGEHEESIVDGVCTAREGRICCPYAENLTGQPR